MRIDEVIRRSTAFALALLTVNLIAIPEYQAHAQTAPEVELHARGGAVLQVVLLHAGQEGLLVDRFCGDWDSSSIPALDGVLNFQWYQVDSVIIPRETDVGPYALALIKGFLWSVPATFIGGIIGEMVCGTGRENRDCLMTTGYTIGAAGFIAGSIYNWPDAEDSAKTVFHPSNDHDREMLRKICVYPDTLPAAIRHMFPKEQ